MPVWVDDDNYRTWQSLTAPVLEFGEVFGLGLMGLEIFAIWSGSG